MTTFTWTIPQMDRLTSDGFVITVNYNVVAVDGTYTVTTYGQVNFAQQPGQTYIPYANLTEAEVIGWVQNSVNNEEGVTLQNQIEPTLQTQINVLKNPVIAPGVPWSA